MRCNPACDYRTHIPLYSLTKGSYTRRRKLPALVDESSLYSWTIAPKLVDESPALVDESPVLVDESPLYSLTIAPVLVDDSPILVDESPVLVDESPILADESYDLSSTSTRGVCIYYI